METHSWWLSYRLVFFILLIFSLFDLRDKKVPNFLTVGFILFGLLIGKSVLGAVCGFLTVNIFNEVKEIWLRKKGFGGADAKVIAGLGAFFGYLPALQVFGVSLLIYKLVLMVRKELNLGGSFAYIPIIFIAYLICLTGKLF